MSAVMTLDDLELLVIVADGASEEEWHDGRSPGVTASEIHAIASGGIGTLGRILDDKLNGSTFKGNAHTKRGHEREGELIAAAERDVPGTVVLLRTGALYGNLESPLHRATPDGLGLHEQYGPFGAEAKHHEKAPKSSGIPADHMDQMQWGMHVTGYAWWLYIVGVGDDAPVYTWVPRDDARIAQLVHQADRFIAWRAAGAPKLDDIPDDVDDALADYARGLALASEGNKLKDAARPVIDKFAATQKAKHGDPLRRGGSRAALFFEPKPSFEVLDETKWAAAEPELYAEWLALQQRVLDTASAAAVLYHQTKTVAPTFRVTPNTEAKK